jgi:hypothetical protein
MSAQSCLCHTFPTRPSKPANPPHATRFARSPPLLALWRGIQPHRQYHEMFFWLGDQFETPLLLQSILMILAQVRNVLLSYSLVEAEPWSCLACLTLHLHPIQALSESGESWPINTSDVILAMADLHPIRRIPRWAHVRIICDTHTRGC